jgi:glycosyltransferase involved in cell wall biosynthesis
MTKVLHSMKVKGIGGAEQHLLTLLPALRERGIDAQFLSLDAGGDSDRLHRRLEAKGVPVHRVNCGFDISPRLAASVVSVVRSERPDLLHTHMVHADIYGSVAARALGVPLASTRHNDDRYLLGPFKYVDRAFSKPAGAIIAISDAVREFHVRAGLPERKLVTIHYGLDVLPSATSELTPEDAGISSSAPLVLAIGRLIEQKDHATLLRAFAPVHAAIPDARLAILGWGTLEAATRELARQLGLQDAVLIPGRVEPAAWLARADLFAHTSLWEGFGIVLLEAMLAGLPVVATRVSAIPEIVDDGTTGILVAPGDDEALATALAGLLGDPERRRVLGEAGRERVRKEFSVAHMTDRTIAVYEGLEP